jgi:hypothetical protein
MQASESEVTFADITGQGCMQFSESKHGLTALGQSIRLAFVIHIVLGILFSVVRLYLLAAWTSDFLGYLLTTALHKFDLRHCCVDRLGFDQMVYGDRRCISNCTDASCQVLVTWRFHPQLNHYATTHLSSVFTDVDYSRFEILGSVMEGWWCPLGASTEPSTVS